MSMNNVVNNLVRAAAGISSTISDSELDAHVAKLLAEEAKARELKWSELGLTGLLGSTLNRSESPDTNLPKTNKRFLASVIRTVDGHNSALLKSQAQSAQEARGQKGFNLGESSRGGGRGNVGNWLFGGALRDMGRNGGTSGKGKERERDRDDSSIRRARDEDDYGRDSRRTRRYDDDEEDHDSRRDGRSSRYDRDDNDRCHSNGDRHSRRDTSKDRYRERDGSRERHRIRDRSKERGKNRDRPWERERSRERSKREDSDDDNRHSRHHRSDHSPERKNSQHTTQHHKKSEQKPSSHSDPPPPLSSKPKSPSPSPSRSLSPIPSPISKMDKYFSQTYDPRLDLPTIPKEGLIQDVGWDNMLAVLKEKGKKRRHQSPTLSDDLNPAPPLGILPSKRHYDPIKLEKKERKKIKEERKKRRGSDSDDDERERRKEKKRREKHRLKEREREDDEKYSGLKKEGGMTGKGSGILEGYKYVKGGGTREWDVGK